MLHLIKFFVLLALLGSAAALSRNYTRGPILLNDDAELHYSVNADDKTISFALVVTNANLDKLKGGAWAGIGISEETSGSMLGADIASVEFTGESASDCKLIDRHVPFSAYPLNESVGNATGAFPDADFCQDDGSWTLVACKRDIAKKTISMEVIRALSAHDEQDRTINAGPQQIIYAYGSGLFKYHDTLRGGRQVELFNKDLSLPDSKILPLPEDIVRNQTIRTDFKVPSDRVTTYACTAFEVDTPPGGNVTLVAADPVLGTGVGPDVAHHLLIYVCPKSKLFNDLLQNGTQVCDSEGDLPNPGAYCTGLLYAWAVGIGRFVTPQDVGFVLGDDVGFVMEMHYDNKARTPGIIDRTGVVLYYSSSRSIEAGIMWLGDSTLGLGGQIVRNDFEYENSCPSNCTANFKQPLKVFGSFLHMHTVGKTISTNRFHGNGTFAETMNVIEFWSNDHQMITKFSPPKIIQPGDRLSTTCVFDTRKRPDTVFGIETKDEMCMDFLFYYPKQDLSGVQGNATGLPSGSLIRCGPRRIGNSSEQLTLCNTVILPIVNPDIEDTVNTSSLFGAQPKQCLISKKTASTSEQASCFPAHTIVELEGGLQKRMDQLRLNDRVHVGNGVYSAVFAFTHRDPNIISDFVQIHSGILQLTLTPGHYIYINDVLARASTVRPGDFVIGANGDKIQVERVSWGKHSGLYNPQTLHGDIAVNSIIASTYTVEVKPGVAHALLAPVRLTSKILNAHLVLPFGWRSVL